MTAEVSAFPLRGRFARVLFLLASPACCGWLALLLALVGQSLRGELAGFVSVDGTRLQDPQGPLRFVSFNVPNLLVIEDAFGFDRTSPWRWPDDFELTDAFRSLRQMGATVARSYVITVRRDDSDMGEFVHVRGPGDFNEEAFRAMDRMLAAANWEGVRVIVPLVDNWKWQGGGPQYAGFRGRPPAAFWTDPEVIADFKQTIAFVLTRRNTITGLRYGDDPAILGEIAESLQGVGYAKKRLAYFSISWMSSAGTTSHFALASSRSLSAHVRMVPGRSDTACPS